MATPQRRPVRDIECSPDYEETVRYNFADAIEDGMEVRVVDSMESRTFRLVDKVQRV